MDKRQEHTYLSEIRSRTRSTPLTPELKNITLFCSDTAFTLTAKNNASGGKLGPSAMGGFCLKLTHSLKWCLYQSVISFSYELQWLPFPSKGLNMQVLFCHVKKIQSYAVEDQCGGFMKPSGTQTLASSLTHQSHQPCHQGPGCAAEAPANIGTF